MTRDEGTEEMGRERQRQKDIGLLSGGGVEGDAEGTRERNGDQDIHSFICPTALRL